MQSIRGHKLAMALLYHHQRLVAAQSPSALDILINCRSDSLHPAAFPSCLQIVHASNRGAVHGSNSWGARGFRLSPDAGLVSCTSLQKRHEIPICGKRFSVMGNQQQHYFRTSQHDELDQSQRDPSSPANPIGFGFAGTIEGKSKEFCSSGKQQFEKGIGNLDKENMPDRDAKLQDTLHRLQKIDDKIRRMATKLEALAHVTEVQMKLNSVNLSYTSGKIPVPRCTRKFRNDLLEAYGYKKFERKNKTKAPRLLRCPVLDHPVPASNLIASHIFKHEWARVAESVMGLRDIDSPKNGMMLFSPIEYCFDKLRLCFICRGEDDIFCHVLDPHLRDKTLVSVAQSRPNWKGTDDEELASLTFDEIDGKKLVFMTDHRPLKDALNFHARQARIQAISKGWIEPSWDFPDFHNNEARWRKLKVWLDRRIE